MGCSHILLCVESVYGLSQTGSGCHLSGRCVSVRDLWYLSVRGLYSLAVPEAEPRLHLALKSPVDLGHDRLDLAPAERADGAASGAASVETRLAALQHMHPAAAAETCPSRGETRTSLAD